FKLNRSYDGLHFFEAGAGDYQGVFLPVVAIEQLERQNAAIADRHEVLEDLLERSDAVAGEDPEGVGDVVASRGCGAIVDMEVDHSLGAEKPQAVWVAAAFVHVVRIAQYACLRMARLYRYHYGFAQFAQRLREAPEFELRDDGHFVAEFEQGAVAFGDSAEGD